ncbi:MAG: PAS domain-containing sensor histidine kinase [Janthinobacterium lividum]
MTSPLLPANPADGARHLAALTQQVLHTMPWGVLAFDRQGVLRLLNPYAARLLGCVAAEALGQPLTQVLPPGLPAELRAALQAALTAPAPVTGEFYLPASQQWLEMTTDPSGATEVLVYWQDITRVVTQRQQYQALADNTPDALARWDSDLCLRYANPAMETKVGQPLAALLGKTLSGMGVPVAIAEPLEAAVQRVFTTGQPQRHFNTLPTPQGERHYQTRLVPEVHDGELHTVLSIAHNITELKQAEAELLRLQLAQQQQLANAVLNAQEVERRRIAESLHNGLGQLLYAAKLHLDALGTVPSPATFAASNQQATELLTRAITQVRALSHQLIPTVLEDFGLAVALREICQHFRHPPLQLHCVVEELPPLPLPFALACYRMAQELVSNLVQHAGATEAHLHLVAQAGWLELHVDDDGYGFDPARPRPPGLGLNAVRDRVQLLGGELTLTSAQGRGTQVSIRVPYPIDQAY